MTTNTHRVTIEQTTVQGFAAQYLSCPCGWENAAMSDEVAARCAAEHEAGADLDNVVDVAVEAPDAYWTEHYGVQLVSVARYPMTGAGLHNRHSDHVVKVWQNRERDGQLIDPHGRPTTDSHSVTTSAQATVITAHPALRNQQPVGPALAVGQLVRLTVNGYPLGTYRIEAGRLSDPVLVKVG